MVDRKPTDRRYDYLLQEMCVGYGFCGGVKDGQRRHVSDFFPATGPVTAEQFAEWGIEADERDPGIFVLHGRDAEDLFLKATDERYKTRWRRLLRDLFIKHMGASVVDVSELTSGDTIMAGWLNFRVDDLSGAATQALVKRHVAGMHENSPACSVHAFDIHKLRQPGVTFWSGWLDDEIVVMGALKLLDAENGEIKSMRVADAFLGRGAGQAMLDHILAEARGMGLKTLWLETGSTEAFAPAIGLYERAGFRFCGPFGSYKDDPFSRFMVLAL